MKLITITAALALLAAPAFAGNGNCGNCQGNNGNGNGNIGGGSFDASGGLSAGFGGAAAFSTATTFSGSGVAGSGVSSAMGEAGALQNSSASGKFKDTGVSFETITEGASYGNSQAKNGFASGTGFSTGSAFGAGGFAGGSAGFDWD